MAISYIHPLKAGLLSKCGELIGGLDAAENPKAVRQQGNLSD
jgi:hypothetical protein